MRFHKKKSVRKGKSYGKATKRNHRMKRRTMKKGGAKYTGPTDSPESYSPSPQKVRSPSKSPMKSPMKSPRSKTPSKVRSKSPLPTDSPDLPTDSPYYKDYKGRLVVVKKPARELKLSASEKKAFESMVRESPKEIPKIKVIEESWHPQSWETDSPPDSPY